MTKKLDIAHSPDADDIFMYMAIKFGWCGSFHYTNTALDIETLNQKALENEFDISAISFGVYPLICEEYALLRTAHSFGYGYGPKLIKKKTKKLRENFKVALSGKHTSNALIFRIKYPNAKIIYKNFLDIENAVLNDEVDAGVLIHESILDFDKELCVEAEIYDIWLDLAGNLPLPLGGMALRRSLALSDAIQAENDLTKAVFLATNNQDLLNQMLLERNLVRVNQTHLNKYLKLYANENSINFNKEQLNALDAFFKLGFDHKFYDKQILTQDYLIPQEYEELRYS